MQPDEYGTMFRVEQTHWWYRALHRLIFETLDKERLRTAALRRLESLGYTVTLEEVPA